MEQKFIKRTHVYKETNQYALHLDVYLPSNVDKSIPVVVYIHGGALIWGSREIKNTNEVSMVLDSGMAYVSIDYRLAPETKLFEIKEDVESAFWWIYNTGASLYGFDVKRVAVWGNSAGGYLALLSGTFAIKPRAIISFYGYGDILGDWYAKPSLNYLEHTIVSKEESEKCIMAGIPTHETHENRWPLYLRARQKGTWASLVSGYEPSETLTKLTQFCPIMNIDVFFPPTFFLHGTADTDVPFEKSKEMHQALLQKGIHSQLYAHPEGQHGFESDWQNTPEEYDRVIQFLKKYLN